MAAAAGPAIACLTESVRAAAASSASAHRPASRIKILMMKTIVEEAKDFIQSQVQIPALASSALSPEILRKIKHSDTWLRQFMRVGDLYDYLRRFSLDKTDDVYLAMSSAGLKTFEDVVAPFEARFSQFLSDKTSADDFVIGRQYSAYQIQIFAKSYDLRSGGMFVLGGKQHPTMVVIKATLEGGKYRNEWIEDGKRLKFYFKSIEYNGKKVFGTHFEANAAILNNHELPVLTFVREKSGDNFTFFGEFSYAADRVADDESRWFELVRRFQSKASIAVDEGHLHDDLENKTASAMNDERALRLARLAIAPRIPEKVETRGYAFIRNPDVVAEVRDRAAGICERCGNGAPFVGKSSGLPYLEVHHKVQLSDGGLDTVDNAIAICPNCHRELHFGV